MKQNREEKTEKNGASDLGVREGGVIWTEALLKGEIQMGWRNSQCEGLTMGTRQAGIMFLLPAERLPSAFTYISLK